MTTGRLKKNLPDGWQQVKLGGICDITNGKTNSQDAVRDGAYPLFDRSVAVKRSDKYLFDKTAVILPGEGAEFVPRYYSGKFDLHQRVYAIFPNESVDPLYLFQYLYANRAVFAQNAVGSTVKSLRLPIIQAVDVLVPPIAEQKKIAEILSTVDNEIQKIDEIIITTRKLKRGLIQDLLVSKYFNSSSKNSIATLCVSNPEQIDPRKKKKEAFKYLDIGTINDGRPTEVKEFIGAEAPSRARRIIHAKDTIISTVRPNLRAIAYITEDLDGYLASTGFCVLRCREQIADPLFIYQVVSTDQFTNYLIGKTKGSNYPAINSKDVMNFKMRIPELSEQKRIAEILSAMDEKILNNQKFKTKLTLLKKGLMQDLLTGRKRTT